MIKVGVDCTFYKNNNADTGLGIFIRQIVEGISENQADLKVIVFVREEFYNTAKSLFAKVEVRAVKTLAIKKIDKLFLQLYSLNRAIKINNIDLFINPYVAIGQLINCPCKNMVVVHDLHFKHYPNVYNSFYRFLMKKWIGRILEKADKIVAISQYTKKDIADVYRLDKNIVVIGNPVEILNTKSIEMNTNYKYILSVNSFAPWKNQKTLVNAFIKIKDFISHKLVLIGYGDISEIKNIIEKNKLSERVILKQYITNDELYAFYKGADLFVNTSLFEGFGRGNIEAGLLGVSILSSKEMCLEECSMGMLEYYAPATDSVILADNILRCLNEEVYDSKRLSHIQRKFHEKYSKKHIADMYIKEIYNMQTKNISG